MLWGHDEANATRAAGRRSNTCPPHGKLRCRSTLPGLRASLRLQSSGSQRWKNPLLRMCPRSLAEALAQHSHRPPQGASLARSAPKAQLKRSEAGTGFTKEHAGHLPLVQCFPDPVISLLLHFCSSGPLITQLLSRSRSGKFCVLNSLNHLRCFCLN